jgi:hypothetical protein
MQCGGALPSVSVQFDVTMSSPGSFLFASLTVLTALFASSAATDAAWARSTNAEALPVTPVASCTWDRPGANAFRGDIVSAVDRYKDIAPDIRERLKARMARRAYDDIVSIRRDSITGHGRYGSTIRDMHFGADRVCREVSRAGWSPQMQERGLVYCDSGQCILVPTICHNVSRIVRAAVADERVVEEVFPPAADLPPVLAAAPPAAIDAAPPIDKEPTSFASRSDPESSDSGGPVPGGFGSGGTVAGPVVIGGGVAPVPETGTWILLLGGLATLVAGSARRRPGRPVHPEQPGEGDRAVRLRP